jgi:hypothetical protein
MSTSDYKNNLRFNGELLREKAMKQIADRTYYDGLEKGVVKSIKSAVTKVNNRLKKNAEDVCNQRSHLMPKSADQTVATPNG